MLEAGKYYRCYTYVNSYDQTDILLILTVRDNWVRAKVWRSPGDSYKGEKMVNINIYIYQGIEDFDPEPYYMEQTKRAEQKWVPL